MLALLSLLAAVAGIIVGDIVGLATVVDVIVGDDVVLVVVAVISGSGLVLDAVVNIIVVDVVVRAVVVDVVVLAVAVDNIRLMVVVVFTSEPGIFGRPGQVIFSRRFLLT